MLNVIKSFHDEMKAEVKVGDVTSSMINVCNGLQQGCVLVPNLFNLYFNAVVRDYQQRCPQAGVCLNYKCGRKLVGDRTAKSCLSAAVVTESQFADDLAIYATSREEFEFITNSFLL